MNEAVTSTPAVLDCAGFRIEIGPDELKVTRDGSPDNAKLSQSARAHIVHGVLLVLVFGRLVRSFSHLSNYLISLEDLPQILTSNRTLGTRLSEAGDIVFPLVLIWAFYAWYLWVLRKGYNDLHCNRENLQVLNMFRGKLRLVKSYARSDVKQITYGATAFNSMLAIRFMVAGKRIGALEGLKCVEAQKILDQLDHLGYDTVRDVGMPMMVEMEEERRKSWFRDSI